jgi:hypothetical protein
VTALPRLANPARTADVLRHLTTELRKAGHTTITIDDIDAAINLLEAGGWVLPKPQPQREVRLFKAPVPGGNGNGHHP